MSLFSSISSCTERNRLGTNRHFDYCRNYFQVRKKFTKLKAISFFGDSGSTFEAKSFSNICDFGQKLTKHFASMCWFFDYLKYWSKIHPSRGVDRSNESVSDAKNSCSTPAWYKSLSTYCPLSHLMSRSFPWARNTHNPCEFEKGAGLTKKEVKFHERPCISMKSSNGNIVENST